MNPETDKKMRVFFNACNAISVVTDEAFDKVFIRCLFIDASPDEFDLLMRYQYKRDDIAALIRNSTDSSSEVEAMEREWLETREALRAKYPEPKPLQRVFIENATLNFVPG